jgi:MYXO-CTERM domain-containing protein
VPLPIGNGSGTDTDQLSISSEFLGGSFSTSNVSFFSGPGTGLYSESTLFTSGNEWVPGGSVAVPEPSTFFPAAVLVAGAFLRRRRRGP